MKHEGGSHVQLTLSALALVLLTPAALAGPAEKLGQIDQWLNQAERAGAWEQGSRADRLEDRFDRLEDRVDRREDRRDRAVTYGPRDLIEDRLDRQESIRDRRENRRDRRQ